MFGDFDSVFFTSRKKMIFSSYHSPHVIKIIIPKGLEDVLNIDMKDPFVKLCFNKKVCYKAEVIAMLNSIPGYRAFSHYSYIQYNDP